MQVTCVQDRHHAASFDSLAYDEVQFLSHRLGDVLHELAVGFIVSFILLVAGEEKNLDGSTNGFCNFTDVEIAFDAAYVHFDAWGSLPAIKIKAPVMAWFLSFVRFGELTDNLVFFEQACDHDGERDGVTLLTHTGIS